jgi:hypothetical protein
VTKHDDITDLRRALRAQHAADVRRNQARERAEGLIALAVAKGVPYDEIARIALRARLGRAPTLDERLIEVDRLRQCRRRFVTSRHGSRAGVGLKTTSTRVGSPVEDTHMGEQLIKRTVIEEYRNVEDADDPECADTAAAAADEDEDEAEDEDEDDETDEK